MTFQPTEGLSGELDLLGGDDVAKAVHYHQPPLAAGR